MKAVVFDLDDTLYLERDYVVSGLAEAARRHLPAAARTPFVAAAMAALDEGARLDLIDRGLAAVGAAAPKAAMIDTYRHHAPNIAPLPGIEPLLKSLAGRCRLGILTDGRAEGQEGKLQALDLERLVDIVIVTDRVAPERAAWKPSPACFALLEERLGVEGRNCVYVADNPIKDFEGPLQRGWCPLRFRHPLGLHAGLPARKGVEEVGGIAELEAWIGRFLG